MFSQRLANCAFDFEGLFKWRQPLNLLKHHQFLPPRDIHREGGSAVPSKQRMACGDRALDVLRIMILTMQDDQFL